MVVGCPAYREEFLNDPHRWTSIVLKMKFEHGRFRIFVVKNVIYATIYPEFA
jgi:hypothetical protein